MHENAATDLPIRSRLAGRDIVDLNIFDEEFRQNWLAPSIEWSTRDPFYIDTGDDIAVLVTRYVHHNEVLLDREERFTSVKPPSPQTRRYGKWADLPALTTLGGPRHDRVRALVQPAFGKNGLGFSSTAIDDAVEQVLDTIEARGNEFDAVSDFAAKVIEKVILEEMLSLAEEHREVFIRMNEQMHTVTTGVYSDAYYNAYNDAVAASRDLIEDRTRNPSDDFIGRLVRGGEGREISDEDIIGNVFSNVTAGLGTTSGAIAVLLLQKCRHGATFAEIIEDPGLVGSAREESLRIHPATILANPRFALEDTAVGGTEILKGMTVLLCQTSANLDPDAFPDPLSFNIHRNPTAIVSFGRGQHFCIGSVIARQALDSSLGAFMRRFPSFDLVDQDFIPTYHGVLGELAPLEIPMRLW